MKRKTFLPIFILLGIAGGTIPVSAYDAHHPDPMAILNGSHHNPNRHLIQRPLLIASPRVPSQKKQTQKRKKHGFMYVREKESRYIPKPEPYSLASKKEDPELLGPQRTYRENDVSGAPADTNRTAHATTPLSTMTESACISLVGQSKFDQYVKKYGGKKGAMRRCLILKRIQG